ncbi:MAG: pseudolysin, partial [Phenylobacterium sp.]
YGTDVGIGEISSAEIKNIRYFATGLDADGDGIEDQWEYEHGLPIDSDNSTTDADLDSLTDLQEYLLGTDAHDSDTDNDGLADAEEHNTYLTNPLSVDSDGDGLSDRWEIDHQLDPVNDDDSSLDSDNDGYPDAHEIAIGTGPFDSDQQPVKQQTAIEIMQDISELGLGWQTLPESDVNWQLFPGESPYIGEGSLALGQQAVLQYAGYFAPGELSFLLANWPYAQTFYLDSQPVELDRNSITTVTLSEGFHTLKWIVRNNNEFRTFANAVKLFRLRFFLTDVNADQDGDGIPDRWEVDHKLDMTDPADALLDPDNDGLNNQAEYAAGTNMNWRDSDGDRLPDGWEVGFGLDPLVGATDTTDSDNDGIGDINEFYFQTSPVDPTSSPPLLAQYQESFETGELANHWYANGDFGFDNTTAVDGSYSLTNLLAGSGDVTAYLYTQTGYLRFAVHSNGGHRLSFYLDGEKQTLPNFQYDSWTIVVFAVEQGVHKLRWDYIGNERSAFRMFLDDVGFSIDAPQDTDADGIPDYWELQNGLDPNNADDALADIDGDGLTTLQEYQLGTDFNNEDSDNDSMPDGWEVAFDLDPLDGARSWTDSDGDGFTDRQEYRLDSSPSDPNSQPQPLDYYQQSFESAVIPERWYRSSGWLADWGVDNSVGYEGSHALQGKVGRHSSLQIRATIYVTGGKLRFAFKKQENANFSFSIDGQMQYIGAIPAGTWRVVHSTLDEGIHQLSWQVSTGSDSASVWIDDIRFINPDVDADGDWVVDESDAFPNDPSEWLDTDGDGIGDNSDRDIDGDGFPNVAEVQGGSDPLDRFSTPQVPLAWLPLLL